MNLLTLFPAVDPIPLPAPVWLFKGLHILTLALHFISVELLLGGLLVATVLSFLGRRNPSTPASRLHLATATALARRLPVVMTFVINLGVPPLLFAQVLYGRALYTSSVLIGVYWIAVIFLLMGCYWHLYRLAAKLEAGKTAWPMGVAALLLAVAIAKIYSTNMTLMLRPEVWNAMYSVTAAGTHLPPHDPTLMPRWLFMLAGGLTIAGLGMIWLSGRPTIASEIRARLSGTGGWLASLGALAQVALATTVIAAQPAIVRTGLANHAVYPLAGYAWLAGIGLIALLGVFAGLRRPTSMAVSWIAPGLMLVAILAMVIYRDGLRDLTLASKGFDVWQRTIVTNWTVVGVFLGLFVAGLGAMGWLIWVMKRCVPVSEEVAR